MAPMSAATAIKTAAALNRMTLVEGIFVSISVADGTSAEHPTAGNLHLGVKALLIRTAGNDWRCFVRIIPSTLSLDLRDPGVGAKRFDAAGLGGEAPPSLAGASTIAS